MMAKCPVCKQPATQRFGLKLFCGIEHAAEWAKSAQDKARAKKQVEARRMDRQKKESFKSRAKWLSELQAIFNNFIRLRDAGLPCVSCGRSEQEIEAAHGWKTGGAWDAGHYLSRGSHPELRFIEDNVARQCKSCNGGSGNYAKKNHEVQKSFRLELIKRVGIDRVEWLEGKHEPLKLTVEEIKQEIARYKAKVKEIEKSKNNYSPYLTP